MLGFESYCPIEKVEIPENIEYGELELSDVVKGVFESKGISKLYKHQEKAIKEIRKGNNVVISSPTASGKTEIYMSEIVDAALKGENSLILYPTKALSRDQLRKFQDFSLYGISPKIYDGDTSSHERKKIRDKNPRILITNVDMLHHILMNNRNFKEFFQKLKYIVVDEAHAYTGILGAHVSNIFWRTKRICPNKIQFILTSATIKNAKDFCSELISEKIIEIKGSATKRAKIRHMMISKEEQSYLTTVLEVVKKLDKKTLIFGNSHSAVERLSLFSREFKTPVHAYRSGLRYDKRKEIEKQFREGKIKNLATTSALELGLDIGDANAVILAGFPGTITRVKQRIGRAGRKGQEALAVFVAKESPLDQYYIDNPEEYLHGTPESCFINSNNSKIRKMHLLAASRDKLLLKNEIQEFKELIKELEKEGMLKKWATFYSPTHTAIPILNNLNIRGIGDSIKIYDAETEKLLGERSLPTALGELFEGAIYLYAGRPYVSERLDLEKKQAFVSRLHREVNEFTIPMRNKDLEIMESINTKEFAGFPLSFGKIHITTSLYGFKIKDAFTGMILGNSEFKKPYIDEYDTYALWVDLGELSPLIEEFGSGLHAFEHIAISMIPAITGCDPKEIGGMSYPSGTVFIYDSLPDGSGITNIAYNSFEDICKMSYNRIKKCDCEKGCPKCIFDPDCGNDNRFLNKESSKEILENILSVK